MRIEELQKNLFFIKFKSQYEVASTFIRMQEFYESQYKDIRGKYFELEDYITIYTEDKGKFDYYSVWSGFNLPSVVIRKFLRIFEHSLSVKEKELVRFLDRSGVLEKKKFYIIASHDYGVVTHETAHGMYYLNREYRKEIHEAIDKLPTELLERLQTALLSKGYCENVLLDETQAYLIDCAEYGKSVLNTFIMKKTDLIHMKRIRDIYLRYNK